MVGKVGPRARVVRLLCLPGDDAALHIDLPATGAGAVGAMRRAHDLVVLPALAIAVFPGPRLICDFAVSIGKLTGFFLEELQSFFQ